MTDTSMEPCLKLMRSDPAWGPAIDGLKALARAYAADAVDAARKAGCDYVGRRGAMVFEVVYSRQRRYDARVAPKVARWIQSVDAPTLHALARGVDGSAFGMTKGEPDTMQQVARNLLSLGARLNLDEDATCETWARDVAPLELVPKLDPVVGSVRGIGPALFGYMRMLCGGDAIKADQRVIDALRRLGFELPGDPNSVIMISRCAAAEVGLRLVELDQLLWRHGTQSIEASFMD